MPTSRSTRRGSHGTRAKPHSGKLCPAHTGGKNWEPSAYNPELGLLYIPSIEGCDFIETVEQKDFADQGGTVKPRERFSGGGTKIQERLYGSLKAVDPVTGEIKAALKLDLSELFAARSRPPATWCSSASPTAPSRPMTPRPCRKCGASTSAPASTRPPITYSVNGKQYVAVLVGLAAIAERHSVFAGAQEHLDRLDAVRVRPLRSGAAVHHSVRIHRGARRWRMKGRRHEDQVLSPAPSWVRC